MTKAGPDRVRFFSAVPAAYFASSRAMASAFS